jgi:hypothetical protein
LCHQMGHEMGHGALRFWNARAEFARSQPVYGSATLGS